MGSGLYRELWDVSGALLTLEEIQAACSAGTIGPATRVRKLGERSWMTVAQIPGISWSRFEPTSSDRITALSSEVEIVDVAELPPPPIVVPPLPAHPPAPAFGDVGRADALSSYPPMSFPSLPSPLPPTRKPTSARAVGIASVAVVLGVLGGATVAAVSARYLGWGHPPTAGAARPAPVPPETASSASLAPPPSAEVLDPPAASAEAAPTPSAAPSASAPKPHAAPPPHAPPRPRRSAPRTG
jgi:hypothetical protein